MTTLTIIKHWAAATLVAVALTACNSHAGSSITTADTAEICQRVRDIYAAVGQVYQQHSVNDGFLARRDALARQYCTRQWNDLLDRVTAIDSARHDGMVGFWDTDYWIMAQDWDSVSVESVRVTATSNDTATVSISLHNIKRIPVDLKLVRENGQWKIDNFLETGYGIDFKQLMLQYLNNHTTTH